MTTINFVEANGTVHATDAEFGFSVMEAAIWKSIPSIEAVCGGSIACGTCLVHVEPAWLDRLPDPSPAECELLAGHEDARPNSRLSCQMKIAEALEGIILHLPAEQRAG